MNMGNVMGSVDWISKDFRSSARLSIASTGHKKVKRYAQSSKRLFATSQALFFKVRLSLGLNGSNFEAKGGIVGGSVNVGRINTLCQLNEDMDVEPFHKLGLQVGISIPLPLLTFQVFKLKI